MELRELRVSQAPVTTKIVVFALFLLQVMVGVACAVLAATGPVGEYSSLLQAAAYALGAGLPLFALVLILVTAKTGMRAIESRTVKFLARVVPKKLQQLELTEHDPAPHCKPFTGKLLKRGRRWSARSFNLDMSLNPDGASAFYRLSSKDGRPSLVLWLSVDISLSKATVCFFVKSTCLKRGQRIASLCKSTLEGAKEAGNYTVDNEEPIVTIGTEKFRKLILRKKLPSDEFLWDSTQTFFFATDLGLMVTSYLRECRALLTTPIEPPRN